MVNVPIRGSLLAQRIRIYANNWHPGAALRRAVAKFHGLLRSGRNRKIALSEIVFYREDVVGKMGPMDLAGGTALIIRRLIVPLTVAVVTAHAGQGFAQGAFPAPLPGQAAPPATIRHFRR